MKEIPECEICFKGVILEKSYGGQSLCTCDKITIDYNSGLIRFI